MSRVAIRATRSLWSNAASTWSSNAGGVSTTTYSKDCLSSSRIVVTSEAGMDSAWPGSTGATRVVRPGECGVSSDSSAWASRLPASGTASAIVWAGNSCSAMATSPKARSRSTRQTWWRPPSASAAARFVATVVLPQPPFAEKTVTRTPRLAPSPSACAPPTVSRRARASSRHRRTAAVSPARSRSSTTSKMPARIASASTDVSTRRRTRITPRLGRVTRIDPARSSAERRSMLGPRTTASSVNCVSRWRRRASMVGSTTLSWPSAACSIPAVLGSRSTMAAMSVEEVLVGDAGVGLVDLGVGGQQAEVHLAVLRAVDDLLRLGLADREREQSLGQLLGLGLALGRGDRRHQRGRAGGDDLHLGQQDPGHLVVGSALDGEEDRHLGAGGDETGHAGGIGELHADRQLAFRDGQVARAPGLAELGLDDL